MGTDTVDCVEMVLNQINAFNEGYELGRKAAEQIYKQGGNGSGANDPKNWVNGKQNWETEATSIYLQLGGLSTYAAKRQQRS